MSMYVFECDSMHAYTIQNICMNAKEYMRKELLKVEAIYIICEIETCFMKLKSKQASTVQKLTPILTLPVD